MVFFIQALFLRTSWAESQMLRQSNDVWCCKDFNFHCCDDTEEGCILIDALEDGSDDDAESDDDDVESNNDDTE